MIKSKVLNITTLKKYSKSTIKTSSLPRTISKTMETVSKMRKWIPGPGMVFNNINNFNKEIKIMFKIKTDKNVVLAETINNKPIEVNIMKEKKKEKTIEALFMVIDELEERPINDSRSNEIIIEVLSERIETVTTGLNN